MSIQKFLERHQAELDKTRKAMERTRRVEADLKLPTAARTRLLEAARRRIAGLEAERAAFLQRIDGEIAAEKEALAALEAAGRDKLGPQPEPPDKPGRDTGYPGKQGDAGSGRFKSGS